MHSLVDKAEARREHEPSRDGIGDTEPPAGGVLRESEWHGAEPGGNRREQREEKDRSCANRFHTLYTTRSRFRPRAFTLRSWPVDRSATARLEELRLGPRHRPPSPGYETCLERITSARCRASSPRLVTARISRKAPLVRKNSSCARRVSTSPS